MANGTLTGASGLVGYAVPNAGGSAINAGATVMTTARVVASDPGGSVGGWIIASTFTWSSSSYALKTSSNLFAGVSGGLGLAISIGSDGSINATGGASDTTWQLCELTWVSNG